MLIHCDPKRSQRESCTELPVSEVTTLCTIQYEKLTNHRVRPNLLVIRVVQGCNDTLSNSMNDTRLTITIVLQYFKQNVKKTQKCSKRDIFL